MLKTSLIVLVLSALSLYVLADTCLDTIPSGETPLKNTDCTSIAMTDDKVVCCYMGFSAKGQKTAQCQPTHQNSTFITPYITYMDVGGVIVDINIDCGPNTLSISPVKCGMDNPLSFSDCDKSSTTSNTCCYFSNGPKSICIIGPAKSSASATEANFDIFGLKVQCDKNTPVTFITTTSVSSSWISFSGIVIFMISLILL